MITIAPFKALRPDAPHAKQVASRPYDVLNSKEAKVEAQGNPNSFLHVTKSEIDLPEDIDMHSAAVYEKAKENLDAFMSRGVLFRESKPCLYIYQLEMHGRLQTGLVAGSSVDDYEQDRIKKHEFTRPEKENDRINHIKTTGAQTGNVFLAYKQIPAIDTVLEKWMTEKNPIYNLEAEDGIHHRIWVINDEAVMEQLVGLFRSEVPCSYIADGHHRAASAAKVRQALGADAPAGADYFLTTLFPSNQLRIMDYNRVVTDLNGHTPEAFLAALETGFAVSKADKAVAPAHLHQLGLYLAGQWYQLDAKLHTYTNDPIGELDVTVLQQHILSPILGIHDQRTDKRIDFVGGIRGLVELEKRVNSGEMAAAISLYPVSIEQLFAIADAGEVMPPKSTWFEPKLRDGLLTHLIHG